MIASTIGRNLNLLPALALAAALMVLPAVGQAAAPAAQPDAAMGSGASAATEPSAGAGALLRRINSAYAALNTGEFDGHIVGHFDVGGQKKEDDTAFTSAFAAPNEFHHQAVGDLLLGCTGQKLYAFDPQRNVYSTSDAPAGRAALGEWPQMMVGVLQSQNPALLLALTSTSGSGGDAGMLSQLGDDVVQLPDTTLGATACPTLQFHPPGHGTVTFVVDPRTALLRQVSFDLREPMAAKGAADVKLAEVSIDYAAASPATQPAKQPGPADAARQFAWTPPANAVLASAATAPTASDDASAAQALVGKAAPDLSLPDLDDKTVKLASLHGSVVVLDFWATWCGPCVESLPNLDALYKEQSPHGLKAFAVDQQEDKDHVKAFVQKKGWSLPVLLDADGSVGQKYSADSIPETVIVGKDGVVKNVFVGVGPDTEDQIKAAVAKEMGQ